MTIIMTPNTACFSTQIGTSVQHFYSMTKKEQKRIKENWIENIEENRRLKQNKLERFRRNKKLKEEKRRKKNCVEEKGRKLNKIEYSISIRRKGNDNHYLTGKKG